MARIAPLAAVLCALLPDAATAQGKPGPDDTLLAITRGTWPTGGSSKLFAQNVASCKATFCAPQIRPSFPGLRTGINGGACWDPIRQGVWVSTGGYLSCVDPVTCRFICGENIAPFDALRGLSPFPQEVGGLAFDPQQRHLYMVDARNGDLHRVAVGTASDPRACVFKPTQCRIRAHMPAGFAPHGLAIDHVRRLLFVASYDPASRTKVHVYATTLDKWCGKLCDVTDANGNFPGPCPNQRVVFDGLAGLGFDSCRSLLYATDGRLTGVFAFRLDSTSSCRVTQVKCCANPGNTPNDAYVGIALRPPPASRSGMGCARAPCNACPGADAALRGDPMLGNPYFALTLRGAPSNASNALVVLGAGGCRTPGLQIGLCAPLLVPVSSVLAVSVPVVGGAGPCSGSAELPVPVPTAPQLCDRPLSVQWLMQCRTAAGIGDAVSTCTSFSIGG